MTKICCVCKRVEQGLHWQDGPDLSETEQTSHGYCPPCFAVVMAELMKVKERLPAPAKMSSERAGLLKKCG